MVLTNFYNEKLCRKTILCPECPFKLIFTGHIYKPCYKGYFRKNNNNHKKHKNRIVMRY